MGFLTLQSLSKVFGDFTAVRDVDLSVAQGEFVSLLGPSGCGKTTTLQMIAGLVEPTKGTITLDGRDITREKPSRRGLGIVFQSYALFPHMTVAENVAFGLEMRKVARPERDRRVSEMLGLVHLASFAERYPRQLSGGQRQRVAIARALVIQPPVLLLDEPLSNLDAQLRGQMRLEIKQLHQRLGSTIIFVTHDQVEAMSLADRIVVMRDGRILQVGAPMDLYNRPADIFTARFIGTPEMNMIDGIVADGHVELEANAAAVDLSGLGGLPRGVEAGQPIVLGVRPQELHLLAGGRGDFPIRIEGRVRVAEPHGSETFVLLDLPAGQLVARAPSTVSFKPGDAVAFGAEANSLRVFDKRTEKLVN